ncbi:MAG TPA: DinB family protein [Thermomicrobiales bacterium]|nr:DinB family protein [Thermomicrobiales bacterium]
MTVEQVLPLLAATPQRIVAATDGLAPMQLRTAPEHDDWSANDVLSHLRSCADVWGDCIATILAEERPTIRAIDPRTWMKQTNYPLLEFQPSLQEFLAQRADLLAVLERLTPDDWSRGATVTGAGAPLERTVLSYAQRLARHERSHIKQIQRIVSTFQT